MDIGSVLLILSAALLSALFISRPLIRQAPGENAGMKEGPQSVEHRYAALLTKQEDLVAALRELDFDHSMGKIPEADYPLQRSALLKAGADVLRQLDELDASLIRQPAKTSQDSSGFPSEESDDELEALIDVHRRKRLERSGGFCPGCGKPFQRSDRFCPQCGAKLGGE